MLSPPSFRRSRKLVLFSTNLGKSSFWIMTRSGTLPPASAAVRAVAVSVVVPTSVSLTFAPGTFLAYSLTLSFALIPVKDQKETSAFGSAAFPLPPEEHPVRATASAAAAAIIADKLLFTTIPLLWGLGRDFRAFSLGPENDLWANRSLQFGATQ